MFKAIENNKITSYLNKIVNVSQELFNLLLTLPCDLGQVDTIIFVFLNVKERDTTGLSNLSWITYPNLQLSLYFTFSLSSTIVYTSGETGPLKCSSLFYSPPSSHSKP